jgi:hypothetical protein
VPGMKDGRPVASLDVLTYKTGRSDPAAAGLVPRLGQPTAWRCVAMKGWCDVAVVYNIR